MARDSTRQRVHDAVLELAAELSFHEITMEGIAARAGVGKQTLYRSWRSTGAILFDAMLARSTDETGAVAIPDTGDLRADLTGFVAGTIAELTTPSQDRLLRSLTAVIQTDDRLADDYRDHLLRPQLDAVIARLRSGGVASQDADAAAELLLGPILHRWLLRTGPFAPDWAEEHVDRMLRAVGGWET